MLKVTSIKSPSPDWEMARSQTWIVTSVEGKKLGFSE